MDVIYQYLLLGSQLTEVIVQGSKVLGQIIGSLLEGHEDTGLSETLVILGQDLHGHEGLAASCAPSYQSRSPFGQSTTGDLIQSFYNRRGFLRLVAVSVSRHGPRIHHGCVSP